MPAKAFAPGVKWDFSKRHCGCVFALAVQPEGTLWIGRDFLAIEPRAHAQLARLNVDASLDENFANADALVFVDGFEPEQTWEAKMRTNSFVILFSLCASLHCTAAAAYVDPIYADGFDPFACAVTDNPQPNAGIAAEPGSGGCAAGMALVATFCVDRYEAALIDDTPGNAGAAWSPYFNPGATAVHAISALDAVPQGYISQIQAGAACTASGKRLCSDTEWLRACRGPSTTIYPYGNTRQPGVCNDYRAINPITSLIGFFDPTQLGNPCVNQQPQTLDRAGARSGCASAEGVFDLMGNIHEWTADPNGTFRGGDYVDTTVNGNGCLYATTAHSTSHYDYSTGFRCCTDAPLLPMRPARAGEH